jgi:hypothetical protein
MSFVQSLGSRLDGPRMASRWEDECNSSPSCGVNDGLNTSSSSSLGRARQACVNMVDEVGKAMTGVGQDMNRMPGMRRGRERWRIRGREG